MNHERDPKYVYIFDTTNRDGEQATEGAVHGIESKLNISKALAEAGVDRIEAGFPSSSDADFEAVRRIAREVRGPVIFGLTMVPIGNDTLKLAGIGRAYHAVKDAAYPGIHAFSVMFDEESLRKQRLHKNEVIQGAIAGIHHARKLIGDNGQVEFSFQNAASAPLEWIIEGYQKVVKAGANVVNVPDTNGSRLPWEIFRIISTLRENLPSYAMISIHCHDDMGLAVANSIAAVKAGADIIECTINGIGERAGNTSLEEVVALLAFRSDAFGGRAVHVNPTHLNHLSKLVRIHYEMSVQQNKSIVGENAFRHRSGIHQDGMINKGGIYEFIDPAKVGWDGEGFELTARSGFAGVRFRLERIGYKVDDASRQILMKGYKTMADERRSVADIDLVWLMNSQLAARKDDYYNLLDLGIHKDIGSDDYHITIELSRSGTLLKFSDFVGINGDAKLGIFTEHHSGAIDALYTGIDKLVGNHGLKVASYQPINIGTGSTALAEVTVVLNKDGKFNGKMGPERMYVGRGRHQDTVRASALAYLDALNNVQPPS